MANWAKWTLAILYGFAGGVIAVAVGSPAIPTTWGLIKGGLVGVAPTIGALKSTLNKDLGVGA